MSISRNQPPRAAIGKEFPFMQDARWTQAKCLAVDQCVRQLSPEDRVLVHQLSDILGRPVDPVTAVELLDGLLQTTPEGRAELRRLAVSEDYEERELAVAKCLEAPASLETDGDSTIASSPARDLCGGIMRLANPMRELRSFCRQKGITAKKQPLSVKHLKQQEARELARLLRLVLESDDAKDFLEGMVIVEGGT